MSPFAFALGITPEPSRDHGKPFVKLRINPTKLSLSSLESLPKQEHTFLCPTVAWGIRRSNHRLFSGTLETSLDNGKGGKSWDAPITLLILMAMCWNRGIFSGSILTRNTAIGRRISSWMTKAKSAFW